MKGGRFVMTEASINFPDGTEIPNHLVDAFWRYETALTSSDLDAIGALTSSSAESTLATDTGLRRGHGVIAEYRSRANLAREIVSVSVHPISDAAAVIVAETAPSAGGRGLETQLWRLIDDEWAVEVAQLSAPPTTIESATWRVVGSPLVAGAESGPLAGETVAVSDLFGIAGFSCGAGVPQFRAESPRAISNSAAVTALLAAGASITGISSTDELASGFFGTNSHFGTPPNGAVVDALPGGSSSGSASAVATGQVSIGLGSDAGGSIVVPASFQGLWGLRSTHGAVSVDGLLALAPSLDAVGWLTRTPALLRAAASASLAGSPVVRPQRQFAIDHALVARADESVARAFTDAISTLVVGEHIAEPEPIELHDIDDLVEIFRTVQAAEAWRSHGEWVLAHPGSLGGDIEARFRYGESISAETYEFAVQALGLARMRIDAVLGDRLLCLPSSASATRAVTTDPTALDEIRQNTLVLCSIAALAGRPALSIPALTVPIAGGGNAPVGFGLVGPTHSDLALIDIGAELARAL